MPSSHKPGAKAPAAGIYKATSGGMEIVLKRGDRFPPTKAGGSWAEKQVIGKKPKK